MSSSPDMWAIYLVENGPLSPCDHQNSKRDKGTAQGRTWYGPACTLWTYIFLNAGSIILTPRQQIPKTTIPKMQENKTDNSAFGHAPSGPVTYNLSAPSESCSRNKVPDTVVSVKSQKKKKFVHWSCTAISVCFVHLSLKEHFFLYIQKPNLFMQNSIVNRFWDPVNVNRM